MDKLNAAAPNDGQGLHEEAVATRKRSRAAPSPRPGPSSKAAQREAADARAKAVEAAESVSKRSSDVEAAQRRAKEPGREVQGGDGGDRPRAAEGWFVSGRAFPCNPQRRFRMTARST